MAYRKQVIIFEAMPRPSDKRSNSYGGGIASDTIKIFGKAEPYRTEGGKPLDDLH